MPPRRRSRSREIVPGSSNRAISVLSSPLVLRGLREFPHNPTWRVKQVFSGTRQILSISPRGYVATYGAATETQSPEIEIFDLELSWLPTLIAIPSEPKATGSRTRASLGWSSSGKSLVAASSGWARQFHLIDAYAGEFRGCFGRLNLIPESVCWSGSEKHFAASSNGSENGTLQLWKAGENLKQFELLREIRAKSLVNKSEAEDLGDQGKLWGFGCAAFHPDEKSLAAVLEYDGEWSDDSILLLRVPSLEPTGQINAAGQVTGLSWPREGRQLLFCASGQAYACDADGGNSTSLPFAAEICRCHPTLPLCAFYNSWLKSSERGRIFVADVRDMRITDECWAEGILDLQWSADGRVLYAVAQDGNAYLYEQN